MPPPATSASSTPTSAPDRRPRPRRTCLHGHGTDAVYGDLNYVAADNLSRVTRRWRAAPIRPAPSVAAEPPPHTVRAPRYTRWGMFNLSLVPPPITSHASVHPPAWHDAHLPPRDPVLMRRRGQQRVLQPPHPSPSRGLESLARTATTLRVDHAPSPFASSPIPVPRLRRSGRLALSSFILLQLESSILTVANFSDDKGSTRYPSTKPCSPKSARSSWAKIR